MLESAGLEGLIAGLEPRLAGLLRIETLRLVVEEAPGRPLPGEAPCPPPSPAAPCRT